MKNLNDNSEINNTKYMKTTMNTSNQSRLGSAQALRLVCAMVVWLFALGVGDALGM